MRHGDIEADAERKDSSLGRLFLVSSLLIVRECMASEISRRFPTIKLSHASTIEQVNRDNVAPDDVVFVDATHEEPGFDVDHLLNRLAGMRAIVLTPEGVIDSLGSRRISRPATLAGLMALVGEACGAPHSKCEREASAANAWRDLTPREREVALLLLEGKSNKEIANEISLSDNTVKMHLTQIMRRLHVTNRTQVVLLLGAGRDAHPAPTDHERSHRETDPGRIDARAAGGATLDQDGAASAPLF